MILFGIYKTLFFHYPQSHLRNVLTVARIIYLKNKINLFRKFWVYNNKSAWLCFFSSFKGSYKNDAIPSLSKFPILSKGYQLLPQVSVMIKFVGKKRIRCGEDSLKEAKAQLQASFSFQVLDFFTL